MSYRADDHGCMVRFAVGDGRVYGCTFSQGHDGRHSFDPVVDVEQLQADRASVVLQVGEPEPGQSLGNLVRQAIELAAKVAKEDAAAGNG